MPSPSQSSLLHYLRCATGLWRSDPRPDGELLAAFAATQDKFAFAVLVGRYGQLVWRTCARVLGDTPEAEDAFQAAFMTLARKAPSLRREPLGGWLHTIAHRLALKARRATGRRDRLVADARSRPGRQPVPDVADKDLQEAVTEELVALPERLRIPLTLYYLEGETQTDVARVMNLSDRAVRDRLNRGLDILRKRLADRGLTISAVTVATMLCPLPTARAVSARLIADTATVSARFAADPAAAPGPAAALAARLLTPRFPIWSVVAAAALAAGTAIVTTSLPRDRLFPLPPAPQSVGDRTVADPQLGLALAPAPRPSTRVLFRHDGAVTALAVSPDGRQVASAAADHVIRVWDSETGRQRARFDAPPEGVTALAFTPDGAELLAEDPKVGLALWTLKTQHRKKNWLGQESGVDSLAFSADGKRLATVGRDGKLISLDLTRPPHKQHASDWKDKEQAAKFWARIFPATKDAPEQTECVHAVAFTPDARTIYAIDRQLHLRRMDVPSKVVEVLDLTDRKVDRKAKVVQPVSVVALSANGAWVAWGNGDNQVGLVEVRSGPVRLLRGHKASVAALAFTADGRTLASVDADGWLIRSTLPGPGSKLEVRKGSVRFHATVLAFSPDGKRLYGANADGEVCCWDAATLEPIRSLQDK